MILPLDDDLRAEVNQLVAEEWCGPTVVTKGVAHDTSNADGFISVTDGALSGYVLYKISGNQCEILVLHSLLENQGIGTALIQSVIHTAKANQCSRLWLITTNDNIRAIRFYQIFGFELTAVHIKALEISRMLKPSIPLLGNENIPLLHEFEFGFTL